MAELVTLTACPPGAFRFNGYLGFKSEYHTHYSPDAYCMESGEYFWGGAKSRAARDALLVEPVDLSAEMLSALEWIDGEAPAKEPFDGPTVGFQPSRDPEVDDGNDLIREAYDEGVARGLWIAANMARAALAREQAPA